MRIATRLILLLVTAVVTVMGVYAAITISETRARLDDELEKMAEHMGLALSVGTLHHLQEGDAEGVQNVLEQMARHHDVVGAAVFDPSLRVVAQSGPLQGRPIDPSTPPSLERGLHRIDRAGEPSFLFPIRDSGGREAGRLWLVLREHSVLPYVIPERNRILLTILALTLSLSALVFYVTRTQIAGPLRTLSEGAEALGKGELERRVPEAGEGEVAELGRVFNRMAENLRGLIDERIRLERQVQQSERLAAVGQLAAGVAHEIGTPLNVISGSAELLLAETPSDSAGREDLQTIVSEVGRITNLVRRLMDFAREGERRVEPVEIPALVESVTKLVGRQLEKARVRMETYFAEGLPRILGDRDQLQQVLLNLVMNAWQAMPEGGMLSIRAEAASAGEGARKASVVLRVTDTGVGIPEQDLGRVFDPFFTTKEVGEGTGLGLAVVHRIVERHGGRISVTSRVGEGSTFEVVLPEAEEGDANG